MFNKIYIISVKGSPRRDLISLELNGIGWRNYEFIDAIEGSELGTTYSLIETNVLANEFIDPFGILTKNVIACSLSHKKAYLKFLEDGLDSCLILEDDARITTIGYKFLLNNEIHRISEELSRTDWDIFMWGLVGEAIPNYGRIEGFNTIVEYKKHTQDWAAHAYQINRKGAYKLLNNNTPVKYAADVNLETGDCKIYSSPYVLIEQTAGKYSKFVADYLEQAWKYFIYDNEFESLTTLDIKNSMPISNHSIEEICFSPDRSIEWESSTYSCRISKNIDFESISWKTFIDGEGTKNKNWCHINFLKE
jgi:glycosyl transferase, family 25